jgi:hypothetical protein
VEDRLDRERRNPHHQEDDQHRFREVHGVEAPSARARSPSLLQLYPRNGDRRA